MGAPENLALLRANEEPGLIVALVVASGDHDEPVEPGKFVGRVGVAARVHERINLPGDTVQITLQGLRRITIESIEQTSPTPIASIKAAARRRPSRRSSTTSSRAWFGSGDARRARRPHSRRGAADPQDERVRSGRFADLAATNMNFRISDKDEVLQRLDVGQRIRSSCRASSAKCARSRDGGREATDRVKIEQHQREFYLRQQLRAIQAELGEADPGEKEALETLKKIEEAKLPEKSRAGSAARDRTAAHALPGVE
jgi:ATP-dependent Lon protease